MATHGGNTKMLGWILFETGGKNGGRQAWPAASTMVESHNDGFRLVCGDASELIDDIIDFTTDFQNVLSFLHEEEEEPAQES
jgi:hypothetical protein